MRSTLCVAVLGLLLPPAGLTASLAEERTQSFDSDPGWDGHNNRSTYLEPRTIEQNFGYSDTHHAGGDAAGEMGGIITPSAEPSYYAKVIEQKSFDDELTASGKLACTGRHFHALLCFFNAGAVNEWRTPNSIALRLYGRGDVFYAYLEYATAKWRAGGDYPRPFSRGTDANGRMIPFEFKSNGAVHTWSIRYDPAANGGKGAVTATIDDQTAVCNLDDGHKADGATFNRFGLLNIIKSADTGGEVWFDDLTIDGETESFDADPNWDARDNRKTFVTKQVRPRFDFGYSETNLAGGAGVGELGGINFRGDNEEAGTMAYCGDRVGPLSLAKPIAARGKVSLHRGVSDSSSLIGFFHSEESIAVSMDQSSMFPKRFLGAAIEGPSRDGFFFFPACRLDGESFPMTWDPKPPQILPDGSSHDWTLTYTPPVGGAKGKIAVTLDGQAATLDVSDDVDPATMFDRFGIVSTWIDGNGQTLYFDDLTYTSSQE